MCILFQLNWNEGSVFTCSSVTQAQVFRPYSADMSKGVRVIFS